MLAAGTELMLIQGFQYSRVLVCQSQYALPGRLRGPHGVRNSALLLERRKGELIPSEIREVHVGVDGAL